MNTEAEIDLNPTLEALAPGKPAPSPESLILYELGVMNETFITERAFSSKQLLEITKLSKQINEQTEQLKTLAPEVHQALFNSINQAALSVSSIIAKRTMDAATKSTEDITNKLERVANEAQNSLKCYHRELVKAHRKAFAFAAVLTLASSLLMVWLFIPKPKVVSPLTQRQLSYLYDGMTMERVWPNLTEKEKVHWKELMRRSWTS